MPLSWLLLKPGPRRRKDPLLEVSILKRWSREKREEIKAATWVFHDSGPLDLLCFLIPLSPEQQGGRREKKAGRRGKYDYEGDMFLHKCSWEGGDGFKKGIYLYC